MYGARVQDLQNATIPRKVDVGACDKNWSCLFRADAHVEYVRFYRATYIGVRLQRSKE